MVDTIVDTMGDSMGDTMGDTMGDSIGDTASLVDLVSHQIGGNLTIVEGRGEEEVEKRVTEEEVEEVVRRERVTMEQMEVLLGVVRRTWGDNVVEAKVANSSLWIKDLVY